MIPKNKIRAVATILPGLVVSMVATYMGKVSQDDALLFNIISVLSYGVYMWGCYNLLIGKGQSRWYLLLSFIPLVPSIIIYLIIKDRNKHLDNLSINKVLNRIIIVSLIVCFWFGSIACLHLINKVFVIPTFSKIKINTTRELILSQHLDNKSNDIYLMGLKIKNPIQGLTVNLIAPLFENHVLNGETIFLNSGRNHEAVIILSKYNDTIGTDNDNFFKHIKKHRLIYYLNYMFLFSNSTYTLIETMNNTYMTDFSWWNLFKDIKVTYILITKALSTPLYYDNADIFKIKTNNLTGYLVSGKYGKDKNGNTKYIKELWFAQNGVLFNIAIIDINNRNFNDFFSSLSVVDESEADNIIQHYNSIGVSKEIELASKLSRKVTIDDLQDLIKLYDYHKSIGDRVPKSALTEELQHIKSIQNIK